MALYWQTVRRVNLVLHSAFVNKKLSAGYQNGTSNMQRNLESRGSMTSALAQAMSPPSPFEFQQYFHVFMFLQNCLRKMLVSIPHYNSAICVVYAVQLVMMAWNASKLPAELASIENALQASKHMCSRITKKCCLRLLEALHKGTLCSSSEHVTQWLIVLWCPVILEINFWNWNLWSSVMPLVKIYGTLGI